jgi:hypothetical protein
MLPRVMRLRPTLAAGLAAALMAGCGEKPESKGEQLTVIAGPITAFQEDIGPPGSSPGETRAFTAQLEDESGRPLGRMDGSVVITDRVTRGRDVREYRMGNVQYQLKDGSLILGGVFVATPRGTVPVREGVRRPVVGGTGAYRAAMGEVTQTPLPAGRQKAVFDITVPKR